VEQRISLLVYFYKLEYHHNDQEFIPVSVLVTMPNRQKIYVGLAVSAGVCSGIALFLYLRHRRQIACK